MRTSILVAIALSVFFRVLHAADIDTASILSPRNLEAPFCYAAGNCRDWPIFAAELGPSDRVMLAARKDGRMLARGQELRFSGLHITVLPTGWLKIHAAPDSNLAFQLELTVRRGERQLDRQTLAVRRAPPSRPISYLADLVDDLIRIFWDSGAQRFLPVRKDGFDQYFRRLQAQGVSRLIVWQSPFPLMADPANYQSEDWRRFESQARAILDSQELTATMHPQPARGGPKSYDWLRLLMQLRLTPEFGRMFTQSAAEHGIKLTASFRPFEAALTKYYEIPAFDADGTYLWGFLPQASPEVNYHPDQLGLAHYREILKRMGNEKQAELTAIEIGGLAQAETLASRFADGRVDLELVASQFPPLDETSFVLVRRPDGRFQLQRYQTIRQKALSRQLRVKGFQIRAGAGGQLVIEDIKLPASCRYLIVQSRGKFGDAVELPVELDVNLRATAGNRLGRVNVYCSLAGTDAAARLTRVAGIPADGLYRTEFQAIENSIDFFRKKRATTWRLGDGSLVIDLGAAWSVEMVDFNRSAARQYVVRQLRTILSYGAFDEILINTRSHTQLAASSADGAEGIRPLAGYRLRGKNYFHYGIDRAYAPISLSDDPDLRFLAQHKQSVERMTTWQRGEWQGPCQSPDTPYAWRYRRNRAVAQGVRALLKDLEQEFPGTRIRAVIPQSEAVIKAVQDELAQMPKPDGGVYGSQYYRHIWGSLNYIPAIGEGMAMTDLSNLSVEPVFLGVRYLPDQGPLEAFLTHYFDDLADNRGSRFRGPRSFFYEAQETLRATDRNAAGQRREEIICYLLSLHKDVNEVILYESADWTYFLPLSDPDVYSFLERCDGVDKKK